jgi:hypothetical protein
MNLSRSDKWISSIATGRLLAGRRCILIELSCSQANLWSHRADASERLSSNANVRMAETATAKSPRNINYTWAIY